MKHAPRATIAAAFSSRGFTLLEMMVVMVLLGLLTTMVLPSMQRWHDSVQTRSRVAAVVEALQAAAFSAPAGRKRLVMDQDSFFSAGLPALAAAASSSASASADSARAATDAEIAAPLAAAPGPTASPLLRLELPAGWRATTVKRAEFLPNGLCMPGYAALRTERGTPVVVVVDGPVCAISTRSTEPQA